MFTIVSHPHYCYRWAFDSNEPHMDIWTHGYMDTLGAPFQELEMSLNLHVTNLSL